MKWQLGYMYSLLKSLLKKVQHLKVSTERCMKEILLKSGRHLLKKIIIKNYQTFIVT